MIAQAERHIELDGKKYFGEVTTIEETVVKWHKKLKRVTEERDILKKAAAYFAKQSG